MVNFPNAKINLGLYITTKRTDGYHDIASCFYPIPWQEVLEITPAKTFSFVSSGIEIPGNADTNLVVKAFQLLEQKHQISPVNIHLHKSLPMGAGLGGGSSDAAHALLLLNHLYELNLSQEVLREYSSILGSDCPFFIFNTPCIATGRGELLTPITLSLKGYHLLLVHPGIHISTKAAYAGVQPKALEESIEDLLKIEPAHWKGRLFNQFEEHLFIQHPELKTIKETLYTLGADYASMSGSGSAMFGIFKSKPQVHAWPKDYQVKNIPL